MLPGKPKLNIAMILMQEIVVSHRQVGQSSSRNRRRDWA
jgi:hypothetical protein